MNGLVPVEIIEKKILLIRGEKVMLDSDLAGLYEVSVKVLNQAVTKKFISKSTLLMFPSFPQFLSGNPVFSLIFLDSCFRRNDQL